MDSQRLDLDMPVDFLSPADAPEKIPYAINRYQTETKRLYQVLNDRLAFGDAVDLALRREAAYLVGNKYTLSDICVFSWGKFRKHFPLPCLSQTSIAGPASKNERPEVLLLCGD
jgi:glutathione S-transferase